jgi:hypothetical protein
MDQTISASPLNTEGKNNHGLLEALHQTSESVSEHPQLAANYVKCNYGSAIIKSKAKRRTLYDI